MKALRIRELAESVFLRALSQPISPRPKMDILRALPAALLLGLFCSACSTTPDYSHTVADPAAYQGHQTFALLPLPEYPDNPAALSIIGRSDLLLAVLQARLIERGFQPAGDRAPDVLVGLRAEFHPGEFSSFSRKPGFGNGSGWDTAPKRTGSRFTLVVEVYSRETKELLWQGRAEVGDRAFFAKERNKVEAIDEILERFGST